MNHNDLDQRLDQAIDALNNEASPAPYEQGDPEMFSLVDTARLAKSLREPAEPDADFAALAVARISADLRQSAGGNGIPPANTPAISAQPETRPDDNELRGPTRFLRRYAQLAAILVVLLLVGGGMFIYQSLGSDENGSPAVGVPDDDDALVVDETPTAAIQEEDVDPVPVLSEIRLDGVICCAVHGTVDGEDYIFTLNLDSTVQAVHVDEDGTLEQVGSIDTPFNIMQQFLPVSTRIAFDNGMLYMPLPGNDQFGLWVVDMTDPTAPVEAAFVETEMPPLSVAASDGLAVVAPMSFNGPLQFFDVSDPDDPQLVGEHSYSVSAMPPVMVLEESRLYVAGFGGVAVVDLSDPSEPHDVGLFENPDWEGPQSSGPSMADSENRTFQDIILREQFLYIAAGDSGLRVVDVSDPGNLQEVSHLDVTNRATRVAAGSEIYVLDVSLGLPGSSTPDSQPHTIHTIDVSNAANPQLSLSTNPGASYLQSLVTVNDTLYLLDFATIRTFDPESEVSAPHINFPQFQPGGDGAGMDADQPGVVVLENNCIRLQSEIGDEHPLLIWPAGFDVRQTNDTVEVVNAEGEVVARVGESIVLWGGFWSTAFDEDLEAMLTSPLPENCPGPYWIINSQSRPLDELSDIP